MSPKLFLSTAMALGLSLSLSLAPGASREAFAFGHFGGGGGHFGGGHFGGAHFGGGHFGGFGGHRFGGFGGHRFGGFGGRHVGGFAGRHFGHFGGSHFGGRHFGGHFGHGFAHGAIGHRGFGHGHFAHGGRFAHGGIGHRGLDHGGRFAHGGRFGRGGRFNAAHLGAAAGLGATGLAAAHFHGFHGFERHGFNRNGFGRSSGWNRWAGGSWGAGWNDWGSGWGYWAGPVFWPFLYGDALSYALWPGDAYDPFFAYGPDFLLTSIFWPGPIADSGYPVGDIYGGPPPAAGAVASASASKPASDGVSQHQAATATPGCGAVAPGVAGLPVDEISQAIRPTDAQKPMLDALRKAAAQAGDDLKGACPSQVPLTPGGRLAAVTRRLEAMRAAVGTVRGPLTTLYASLDDAQKKRLDALGSKQARPRDVQAASGTSLCKAQPANFTLLPVQRIDAIIKPTDAQAATYDALKTASSKAAADLEGSCPTEAPTTLPARLDAVANRLDALIKAADEIKPSLAAFYDKLSNEQKARFNVIDAAPAPSGQKGQKSPNSSI